ncbi:MAG: hypothetical protein HYT09_03645 [Candidatus Levybacteria bacterium]|nr:hypothetical protein [Candidatus Levybacteria bacterium]
MLETVDLFSVKKIIIPVFVFSIVLFGFLISRQTSFAAACTTGGSWSDYCKPASPNGAIGEPCGDNSGTQTIRRTTGSKNCTPKTETRKCDPTTQDACGSNVCYQGKCVRCKFDDLRHCTANQYCEANICVDKVPCTSGGSWSECKADNPNAAIGAVCDVSSGSQTITHNTGSENCIQKTVRQNCIPPQAQACGSNLCGDNGRCVKCKNDSHCGNNEKCESNKCVQKPAQATATPVPQQKTCDKNQPSIVITPIDPANGSGKPGDQVIYTTQITNNDNGDGCDLITFVLSVESLPNDSWTAGFDDNTLQIAQSKTKSTKFKVKAPNSANSGPKELKVGVQKQSAGSPLVKGYSTYTVTDPEAQKVPTPTPTKKPENNNQEPAPAEARSPLIMGMSLYGGVAPQEGREATTLAEIDAFGRSIGQYPATFSIWNNLGNPGETTSDGSSTAFPSQTLLNGLTERNITPVIFMQPVGSAIHLPSGANPNNPPAAAKKYSNASIANGSFDPYLRAWAKDAKAYGKPVILRYAHEMNGHWFPWSAWKADGGNGKNYYNVGNTPENYVKAWQHVYDVVKKEQKATNVKFLWAPWGSGIPTKWFPGNDYVDYVGFDSYAALDKDKSMADLYDPLIKGLRDISKKKIIVAETGIDARYPNPKRSDWITNGYTEIYNKYPDVSAIIYFNFGNWELTNGAEIRSAYASAANQTHLQGRFSPFKASAPAQEQPPQQEQPQPTATPVPEATPIVRDDPPQETKTEPTATPVAESKPLPTATPIPGATRLNFAVGLEGIGSTGDQINSVVSAKFIKEPNLKEREFIISIYSSNNEFVSSEKTKLQYNNGIYIGVLQTNSINGSGKFGIFVRTNSFLQKSLGITNIQKGEENKISQFNLINGDVNGDNNLTIADYNIIKNCSIYSKNKAACDEALGYPTTSDINDDGIVDDVDMTLWTREISAVRGD